MKRASYISTKTTTGGVGKYPLSTQTLDFIQQQILLLQTLSLAGGKNYILKAPDGANTGVAVIGGEVLTLTAKPVFSTSTKYVNVTTTKTNIEADGETYEEAREERVAAFSSSKGTEAYDINTFANVSGGKLSDFPTNETLATQIKNLPSTVLNYLTDVLAEKLTAKKVTGMTKAQMDALISPCLIQCVSSVALFDGCTEYTLAVTAQGTKYVRQELTQGNDTYTRLYTNGSWGDWSRIMETAMHIDVKVVGTTVYLRHGELPSDAEIVLLRKKHRSGYRSTGGSNSLTKNKGKRIKRLAKTQYVHFKGIVLSKGTAGKWYVPKCIKVADTKVDGVLIDKEMPSLCYTLFYAGKDGYMHIQGNRSRYMLKTETVKGLSRQKHAGYAQIGIQVARTASGSKDSGGEIVRLKYRAQQVRKKHPNLNQYYYAWLRGFSVE